MNHLLGLFFWGFLLAFGIVMYVVAPRSKAHTCLPAMRQFELARRRIAWVVNNGAAGMPNFAGDLSGLCTRIAMTPSTHAVLHEVRVGGAYVALLPVRFDAQRWQSEFLAQWPQGSPAWLSYFDRIAQGPAFDAGTALRSRPAESYASVEAMLTSHS